ncbi:MAG: UDP-glucose--hexose-1-phosphate uridylyltransferase [Clostridia bacterium]|nr:UDP-glucose--hexose-1-phosphate uridylyltransferase [Clostridia bacterium]
MNVYRAINALLDYGVSRGLLKAEDRVYSRNMLLHELRLDSFTDEHAEGEFPLEDILAVLLDDACARGVCDDSVTFRDLLDAKLMDCLMPRPSEVIAKFRADYAESPEKATDNYYKFSRDTDYIRRYRIRNDIKWVTKTEYGDIDITINMSKPEKDPRLIKLAGKAGKAEKYPACALCAENEGYYGRVDNAGRSSHRMIPIKVQGQDWFFQYSPYVYFNEHSIFLNAVHTPMIIDRNVFIKLLDIIKFLPHYFVGSNAGLPIVGGSILAHEHFQGGRYEFAMAKAPVERGFSMAGFPDISAGIVKWPMSVIRVSGADPDRVVDAADKILKTWKGYTDESAFIFANTDGEEHNTVTPIARKRGDNYEIDLVLRNNTVTDEYPDGLYHAHPEYHHIKKENIGLIEVMGLAVLPSRLKYEMEALQTALLEGADLRADDGTAKHADWAEDIAAKHPEMNSDNIGGIFRDEIGLVFTEILGNCGVFKRTEEGMKQFDRFVSALSV